MNDEILTGKTKAARDATEMEQRADRIDERAHMIASTIYRLALKIALGLKTESESCFDEAGTCQDELYKLIRNALMER